MKIRILPSLLILGATWALAQGGDYFRFPYIPFDHKAIQYGEQPPNDAVARLDRAIQSGEANLTYDPKWGYLPSVLKHLGINIDSQMLVLSKTSFQAALISPERPRAIYFSDTTAVGYVQNGEVLEFVSLDPKQGENFYTLSRQKTDRPSFLRRDSACFNCHVIGPTLNIPGILITSVYPGVDGMPAFRGANQITDHRTPLSERWGGWYVTGTQGSKVQHRGNAVGHDPRNPTILDTQNTQNLTSLANKLDISAYLAPTSDIVALMTIEHQTRVTNLMTRIGWEARVAAAEGKNESFKERLDTDVEEMLAYMLFVDEARMPDPITGVSTFTRTFAERGPRDKKGRSLRDFDLQKRLFRYPLSYMVYSEAFDSLPDIVRERLYQRLYDVLTGKDMSAKFARLSAEDRRSLLEILRETKPNLPSYWSAPQA